MKGNTFLSCWHSLCHRKSRAAKSGWAGWVLHKGKGQGELKFHLGSTHQAALPREERALFSELHAAVLAAALGIEARTFQMGLFLYPTCTLRLSRSTGLLVKPPPHTGQVPSKPVLTLEPPSQSKGLLRLIAGNSLAI